MLLLLLGLGGRVAWAGLSEAEVATEAVRIQADLGGRLLLAAVGPEAEKLAERVLRTNASLEAEVVKLPTAGDPVRELWAALNSSGLRCALRLSVGEDGSGWAVTPFGNCAAAPTEVAAMTAVLPPEDAASRFVERRLALADPVGRHPTVDWDVQDGAGTRLSAPAFSSMVRDTATTDALLREQRGALRAHTGLRITSGVLVASALVPLINNPGLTTAVGEDRAWTSLFLASSGVLAWVVAPRAIEAVNERQRHPASYYTDTQAQEWITTFNSQLQQDLGLAPVPGATTTPPEQTLPEIPMEAPAAEEDAP